ncbi:PQQ-dependent sugar dehydrogenase [Blastopirellula marina]|uniref:Glucose sorbosone dehydrogenase n=1 Tax=Blastopirellula marina TaxID=124 RepID=A0A2S8F4I2_9BACT|nr:PQQ-dependent sugar dehydrogenase [Blastopirellula marina]PQO27069.1 glucose sorbosone dehydrogenase [Blastopirellula marina]PTL41216.1 glucose sorbosone dehydrogenase [Blastopirellula marina]
MNRLSRLLSVAMLTCGLVASVWAQKPEEGPPIPNDPVLPVKAKKTFTNLRIRRPVTIANAGDGSNRIFFAEQQGVIVSIPNDPEVEEADVFLDIEDKVHFDPKKNEEGLLGLAFHPKFKENGEFFVYYTIKKGLVSHVSRFKTLKDDPTKGDPNSEEVLLTIEEPYWNHNGGSIEFGPDGYLYIGLGDGGSGNDPHGNGQNLGTWLGSILRIDVDKKEDGKNYAIPADNPFVDTKGAKPEIYAYGLRNVWRLTFDRKTGACWVGDVGQGIWEEIDIITKGGNYGWNVREGLHPFSDQYAKKGDKYIDPIFEYHHNVGKSITSGYVYRGKKVPQLEGKFLYADYVAGKIWALEYDYETGKAGQNYRIEESANPPVVCFGETEDGEVLMSAIFGDYGSIYEFVPAE